MSSSNPQTDSGGEYDRKGVLLAAGAYLAWCVFPLYFRLLEAIPPLEILIWRIIWSLVFMLLVITGMRRWPSARASLRSRNTLAIYAVAAVLLAINWYVYIWAVNNAHVLEGSLGYFINPLVSVLLGVIFLHERLRIGQWGAIGLAALAVAYLTWNYGQLPWIALSLALSFGFYGLVKKRAPLPAAEGMLLETGILVVPAILGAIWFARGGMGPVALGGLSLAATLMLAGPITAVPLLMFAAAAKRVPLAILGVLQYIAPTGQFLVAVYVFHEPFPPYKVVGFALIWAALGLFWLEGVLHRRRLREEAALPEAAAG